MCQTGTGGRGWGGYDQDTLYEIVEEEIREQNILKKKGSLVMTLSMSGVWRCGNLPD